MKLIFTLNGGGTRHFSLLMLCGLFPFAAVQAQITSILQDEVDAQVWRPFVRAFNACDSEAFLAVHAPSALRVPQSEQDILTLEEYREQVRKADTHCLQEHQRRTIELRFENRIARGDYAMDTGYYCTKMGTPGNEWELYGYFTVVMQRTNGVWKIVLDTDNEEHATKERFLASEPLLMN